ncbi:MAG: recombinase family protein [Alphaproteobacteria bacterium]
MNGEVIEAEAIIYCRVSSAAQVAKGHGIASQETRCREFARMKGYAVVAVFKDEAVSGGLIDRPGMLELLADLRKRKGRGGAVVIIDDISRLARDIKAHLDLRSAIQDAGGRLESPSIEFGEDSDSILVENLLASVSQHQRQKNAEQVHNRQRARLLNGYWTFSCPPGYRYEAASGEGKVLLRDEPLASIIAEAMEGFAAGRFQTQAEVKRFFEGFPEFPKTRFGTVTNEAVNRILTRVLYAGYLERPEWGVALRKARHEPLVSLETFERIQTRLTEGCKLPARADVCEDFPLRGFVLCGDCGKPLTAAWSKSKTGAKHAYYTCFNKRCESARKSIRRDVLEGEFEGLLADVQPASTLVELALDMFRRAWDQQAEQAHAVRDQIRRRVADIEKQIATLLDNIVEATSRTVVARYEARINELERERLVMAEKLETEGAPKKSFEEMFELTLSFLSNPWRVWEKGDLARRHAVLKMTFDDRLVYVREGGFRTPKPSLVFRVLDSFRAPQAVMAEGVGFEPTMGF